MQTIKKIYIENENETLPENVLPYSHKGFIASLNTVYSTFLDSTTSSNRYIELVNNLHDTLIPFGTNGIQQKIYDVNVGSRVTAIIENNENFVSYVFGGKLNNFQFLQETYLPETYYKKLGGLQNDTYMKDVLTKSDKISLKGLVNS